MACTAERTFAILGLPQINPVNEEIKQRMEVMFGSNNGYDYTYLYPGLQKVVQAAGRVIRTVKDQGVVYLIDDLASPSDACPHANSSHSCNPAYSAV